MSKPELGYWKIRGRAAATRLLLTYAGVEFTDTQYEQGDAPEFSKEVWTRVKPTFAEILDFPNLPYYIDEDVKITQSNAILKHIARKYNLDGESVTDQAVVDMMLDQAMDLRNAIVRLCYNPDFDNLKGPFFENLSPTLALFEKRLQDREWFAGTKPTVADFPMYDLLEQLTRMKEGLFDAYPNLKAFLDRFSALPKLKEYLAKDEVKNIPINNKHAIFR